MSRDPHDDGQRVLLSEPQRQAIAAWVRQTADLLGLKDWRIEISPFESSRSTSASSHMREDADLSWIAIGRAFFEDTPEEQRATLTHELLHCHFQPVTRMAEKLLESELGTRAEAMIDTAVSRVEERSIDRLATGLARLLPAFAMAPSSASDSDADAIVVNPS